MNDSIWAGIRYTLIGAGMFLAGLGLVAPENVVPYVDNFVLPLVGALISGSSAAWGMYVIWKTRRVPLAEARRPDVRTINPATGAVEPAMKVS